MNARSFSYCLALAVFVVSGCVSKGDEYKGIYYADRSFYYSNRGLSSIAKGDYEQALSDFNKVIRIEPERHEAYGYRAQVYILQNKLDLAISEYNTAIDKKPLPQYYMGRGTVYRMKRQYDLAIKEYIKAIRIEPKFRVAYNNLAWLLATCSDEKYRDGLTALKFAKKAVDLDPESSASLDTLAAAYAAAGDFDNAIKTQEKVIQLFKEEGKSDLLDGAENRLESYKKHIPWTET